MGKQIPLLLCNPLTVNRIQLVPIVTTCVRNALSVRLTWVDGWVVGEGYLCVLLTTAYQTTSDYLWYSIAVYIHSLALQRDELRNIKLYV